MKFEATVYTLLCICEIHEDIRYDFKVLTAEQAALEDIIDVVILKIRKLVIGKKMNAKVNFKITKYQAYFLGCFLFENLKKFKGISEQASMRLLANKLHQPEQ